MNKHEACFADCTSVTLLFRCVCLFVEGLKTMERCNCDGVEATDVPPPQEHSTGQLCSECQKQASTVNFAEVSQNIAD